MSSEESSAPSAVPAVVLGATGYVGGELLRLLAGHPNLELRGAFSQSRAGDSIAEVFPHLAGPYGDARFASWGILPTLIEEGEGPLALFAALPHGASAATLDDLLERAEKAGRRLHLVDLSADFRHPAPALYARLYGAEHPAPERLATFYCGLPDLDARTPEGPVAHPGCFTTASTLAMRPLHALALAEPSFQVSAVTGSSGSGRSPGPKTHHPERHGALWGYAPMKHRHQPEMERLVAGPEAEVGPGEPVKVLFLPHSGPFVRGIHATVIARLKEPTTAEELAEKLARFYASTPFVRVTPRPPSLREVVGSNRCHLGVATEGHDAVIFSVIDNLIKGAAGGAMQWMNRLLHLPDVAGLEAAGPGWG